MQALVDILEKLESFIYKILIWLILIPKTLLKIVLDPAWAPGYIKDELDPKKGASRFDEYFSPIVLLLVVALMPYVIWSFIPTPGVKISSPANDTPLTGSVTETPSAKRALAFDAEIRFISTSATGYITTFWRVEKEDFIVGNYFYPVQNLKRYTNNPKEIDKCLNKPKSQTRNNSQDIVSCLKFTPPTPTDYVDYDLIDSHTVRDSFSYEFSTSGSYYIVVDASKFDNQGNQIETYSDEIFVDVPKSQQDNVSVYSKSKPGGVEFSFKNVTNQFENEKTIFLALGLLIPPLLFAMVLKLLDGEELTEGSIKEIFHVQCYYFSPLALMFWATKYSGRFITPDLFYWFDTRFKLFILLPLILAVFWFISVQTDAISKQGMKINGEQRNINGWPAFLIVIGCVVVLVPGILLIVYGSAPAVQEGVRRFSIWLYPLLAVGLLTYHILLVTRRKDEKPPATSADKDSAEQPASSIDLVLKKQLNNSVDKVLAAQPAIPIDKVLAGGIMLIILITISLVLILGQSPSFSSQDFDATQQTFAAAYSIKNIVTIEIQTLKVTPPDTPLPTSTPSPLPIATPSPLPTATPFLLPTATPFPLPTSILLPQTGGGGGSGSSSQPIHDTKTPKPTKTPTPDLSSPTPTSTPSPSPTPTSTSTPSPTPSNTQGAPTPVQHYIEEPMDTNWSNFVTQGDISTVDFKPVNGKFSVSIPKSNDTPAWFYLVNAEGTAYADVQIETSMKNNRANVGLICRATGAGWYEFNVSNSGSYTIYAYDGSYNVLANGDSAAIKSGQVLNVYTAICSGNNLELWINGLHVATTQDDRFADGFIGLSVSSPKGLEVNVDFVSLKVGQP